MSSFSGSRTANGQATWYLSDLQYAANMYSEFKVTVNGISYTWTSSYTGKSTQYTTTGHSCGTTVNATGYATIGGTTYTIGSYSVAMQACNVSPPSGVPSVSATPMTGKSVYVSWTPVSGATAYDIYVNNNAGSGDYYRTSTTGTSASTTVENENWNYTVKVVPYNYNGTTKQTGSIGQSSFISLDETPPISSGVFTYTVSDTSISVTPSLGADGQPTNGNPGTIKGYKVYYKSGTGTTGLTLWTTLYGDYQTTTINGLTPGTTYTIAVKSFDVAGNVCPDYTSSSIATTSSIPTPVTLTSRFDGGFSLSWGSIAGATHYQLDYKLNSSSGWSSIVTTGTSYSLYVGMWGFDYNFRVRSSKNNQSTWSSFSSTTTYTAQPKIPAISGVYNGGVATIYISGIGESTSLFTAVSVERRLISTGALVDSNTITTNGGYAQWTISASTVKNYYFVARTYVNGASGTIYSPYSEQVKFARPQDFQWTFPKTQNQPLKVSASEWNDFTARINLFREYRGLNGVGFTSVSQGNPIMASYIIQAINAISPMSPPVTLPSAPVAGTTKITASIFNGLRDSLNSIQ